ncbi:MAG TPA: stage V sporulation protein AB [Candidatus Lachnoclostridium stercorigallinarum]|uniref:Stage V sporulation protein AB n=1 Tax=Candidatus Lachnoclostridium stercorigallinarum TaxID=2838634 RepID=A0A9D2GEZ0_9FIRM|nr:stage V sporulation protein AB [Candidatus Lachnoclostridium stercorigallinarum]
MSLKRLFLAFAGFSAGGVTAAGVFAFLAMIGVFPRLIGKTGTGRHICLYETALIIGGIAGNVSDILEYPVRLGEGMPGQLILGTAGLAVGIFVGCLVMSLAETLKALPTISRRIRLAVGLQYVILSVALGKTVGALVYFAERFGM